jgi:hypothetical protein
MDDPVTPSVLPRNPPAKNHHKHHDNVALHVNRCKSKFICCIN